MPYVQLYNQDCVEGMAKVPTESIDLTVTSPPYDNLRDYHGFSFDFDGVSSELYRVTKDGGVVVWIVGDAVINGSETGSSFRQALGFMEAGFLLHDTMIYRKNAFPFSEVNRYNQVFEYMFVLSRGKPKAAHITRVPTKIANRNPNKNSRNRQSDGTTVPMQYDTGKEDRNRANVWTYNVGYMHSTKDRFAFEHPAIFPEALARDHILSWSNEGDTVLDPFAGSGTTLKVALQHGRNAVGFEISAEYCDIIRRRLAAVQIALPI